MVYSSGKSDNHSFAEIGLFVKQNENAGEFISKHFMPLISYVSPKEIFPYLVNFEGCSSDLIFCGLPIVKSWVFNRDLKFTFFILVKMGDNVKEAISKYFGTPNSEMKIEIKYKNEFPSGFQWHTDGIRITLSRFSNIFDDPELFDCSIIVFGNMTVKEIYKVSE